LIVRAADIEVCPLRDGSGAIDLGCVGLEKVDLIEWGDIFDAAKDDEEHHDECPS
jgi:hypothetical protein